MYSEIVLDHFGNPRNAGVPPRFNAKGVAGNPDAGPFLVLYLDIREARIAAAGFQTYGCGAAIAAGSLLTELVLGRTVAEAARLDAAELQRRLGGLPLGKEHCAAIAITALADALKEAGGG